jgi:NADPH2:quinone reductase
MTDGTVERRVAYARTPGTPDVLQVDVERLPPPKSGEVLLRVEAVGLNHVETLIRTDTYSIRIPFPYAVGFEGAGVVVAAGPDVNITLGARVCWTAVFGSCATFVVAPAAMLARLPDSLSFEDGASLAHGGVTAAGLVRHWPLERGSTAVVWGAAGSVGLLLVASLAERGVRVIGIKLARREPRWSSIGRVRTSVIRSEARHMVGVSPPSSIRLAPQCIAPICSSWLRVDA